VIQEFKNVDGEEYQADMPMSPGGFHGDSEVYFLPLTEVSLPQSVQPKPSHSGRVHAHSRATVALAPALPAR